jgi:hypothetical protein
MSRRDISNKNQNIIPKNSTTYLESLTPIHYMLLLNKTITKFYSSEGYFSGLEFGGYQETLGRYLNILNGSEYSDLKIALSVEPAELFDKLLESYRQDRSNMTLKEFELWSEYNFTKIIMNNMTKIELNAPAESVGVKTAIADEIFEKDRILNLCQEFTFELKNLFGTSNV